MLSTLSHSFLRRSLATVPALLHRTQSSICPTPTLTRPFCSSKGEHEEKKGKTGELGKLPKEKLDYIKKLMDRNFPVWLPRKCNRWVFYCRVNEMNFKNAKYHYGLLSPPRNEELAVMYKSYMTCVEPFRDGRESRIDGSRKKRPRKAELRKAGGGPEVSATKESSKKTTDSGEEQHDKEEN